MKRRVLWAPSARTDLREIVEYIWLDRREAAIDVNERILSAARSLSDNADRGKIVPEFLAEDRKEYKQIVIGPYRLIYRIDNKKVQIVLVVDGRRDLPKVFSEWIARQE